MRTTDDLRQAMHTLDVDDLHVDVADVRRRAGSLRRRRRAAGVVGLTATVALAAAVPSLLAAAAAGPPTGTAPRPAAASPTSAPRASAVPRTLAEAARHTEPKPRTGALPDIRSAGREVTITPTGMTVQLRPAPGGGTPRTCMKFPGYSEQHCEPFEANSGGWLTVHHLNSEQESLPLVAVLRAPVTSAVAALNARQIGATLHDLGHGCVAVVAMLPARPRIKAVGDRVQMWAFDDAGTLVAYYDV
jgi:hypothetical protein